MQQTEGRAGACGNEHTRPQACAMEHREPAAERTGDHDAFGAQIQYARALAQQYTERAENQRRRNAPHGDPEWGRSNDVAAFPHASRTLTRGRAAPTRTAS